MSDEKNNTKQAVLTGLAWVSGWRILQQAGSAVGDAVGAAGRIGDLVKTLFKRRPARRETFGEAVQRLHLVESDLQQRLQEYQFRTALWFLAFAVALCFLILSPLASDPVSHALNSAGGVIVCAACMLTWRFRTCQVQDRSFYSFGGWIVADPVVRRIGYGAGIVLLLALAVASSIAHAADGGAGVRAFMPAAGDASVTFLREIFGPVIDSIWSNSAGSGGDVDSPLGRMLGPFNSAVLFMGMIFVGYTTIKGTVDTAHDGELLGKKMSEIWVPIRTVGGAALVLPGVAGYRI